MIKHIVDKYFVKVYVEEPWLTKGKTDADISTMRYGKAKDLMADVKRHIDDHGGIEIDLESHFECTFCGHHAFDKDDYECCDESVAEHDKEPK